MPTVSTVPGAIAVDPAGKFLYVSNAISQMGFGGLLYAYSIDAASGALAAVPGSPFDVGGGIQLSVAVDASGRFLIVPSLPKLPGNGIAVLSIYPDTGALTAVPGSPFGQTCGVVVADTSGPHVYIGTYSSANTVGVLALSMEQATGALTPIGEATLPGMSVSFIALTH
jgi:6-phosphogluconolactonase